MAKIKYHHHYHHHEKKSDIFLISGHMYNDFLCCLAHTKASQTTQRKLHQQSMELIKREILKGINPIVRRIVG